MLLDWFLCGYFGAQVEYTTWNIKLEIYILEFKIRIQFFQYKAQNLKLGLTGSFFRTLGIAWGRYASVLSGDACCINRMLAILFPDTFLYKIKSGRAHLFFYNMLHRRNAREFFSELILI